MIFVVADIPKTIAGRVIGIVGVLLIFLMIVLRAPIELMIFVGIAIFAIAYFPEIRDYVYKTDSSSAGKQVSKKKRKY